MKAAIIFILGLFFLAGCAPAAAQPLRTLTPAANKTPTPTLTPRPSATLPSATPTPIPTVTVTQLPTPTANTAGLIILAREIKQMDIEHMRFVMADGQKFGAFELSEGDFQNERGQLSAETTDLMSSGLTTEYKGGLLTAEQNFNHDYSQGWVTVEKDGRVIYQIYTGPASPIISLRGLHSYSLCAACARHWVLETALIARTMSGSGIDDQGVGQLVEDGTLINKKYGYQAAFNFQTLGGKPFYFFQRIASLKSSDKIDVWYNGLIVPLGYDEIPHYGSASASLLNPRVWTDRLVFFARRGQTWYLVQISVV